MIRSEMLVGVVIVVGAVAATSVGTRAPIDAEVTAEHVKEATERKQDVRPADRIALSMPIQCDATATHSGTPGVPPRTRCYVRKENR